MLIYARIILLLIVLTSIFSFFGGFYSLVTGSWLYGIMEILIGGLFIWLGYSNFTEASRCASGYHHW